MTRTIEHVAAEIADRLALIDAANANVARWSLELLELQREHARLSMPKRGNTAALGKLLRGLRKGDEITTTEARALCPGLKRSTAWAAFSRACRDGVLRRTSTGTYVRV